MRKSYSRINNILIFGLSFVIFTLALPPLFFDPDVAWHIAAGDEILKSLKIPYYDRWSYVGAEQRWYNISWLWDILCALINMFFGFYGLATVQIILISGLCAYCYSSLRSRSYDLMHDSIIIGITLTSLLLIDVGHMRPQIFSCYMMVFFNNKLYDFYYNNKEQNIIKILPFISCIWANMHGGFVVQFVIISVFIVISIYQRKDMKAVILPLLWLFILCALSTLLNPLGLDVYIGVFRTLHSDVIHYISEWRPFIFGTVYSFSLLILVLLIAGSAMNAHYANLKISTSDWVIGVMFLAMSLASIRNFAGFAAIGVSFTAAVIDRVLPKAQFEMKLRHDYKKVIIMCSVLLALISNVLLIITQSDKRIGLSNVPVELIKYTAQHYTGCDVMHSYNIGGYIILFGGGKIQHFIDGRAGTVFTEKIMNGYINILNRKATILELAHIHGVDCVIMLESEFFLESQERQQKWDIVYNDNKYLLLINSHFGRCHVMNLYSDQLFNCES